MKILFADSLAVRTRRTCTGCRRVRLTTPCRVEMPLVDPRTGLATGPASVRAAYLCNDCLAGR